MNSSIVTPRTYQLGATSANIPPQQTIEGSVSFGYSYPSSTSWRRFIRATIQQPQNDSTTTTIPAATTTTEGPTVLKPEALSEDYDERAEEFLHFLDSFESETENTDDVTADQ
jgi:hypothetical protein